MTKATMNLTAGAEAAADEAFLFTFTTQYGNAYTAEEHEVWSLLDQHRVERRREA